MNDAPITGDPSTTLAERLGSRVQARRHELGLTLAALSERCGVSVSYLSAIEKGVNLPSLPVLAQVTEALDVPIRTILAEEGSNLARTGRAPETDGAFVVSHPDLRLRVEFLRCTGSGEGRLPVGIGEHDVFVYVLEGDLAVTTETDTDPHHLYTGDALSTRTTGATPRWTSPHGCTALWATAATDPA